MAKENKISVTELIINFINQGYSDADIIRYLREQGYSATAINEGMHQAKIKAELQDTAEDYEDYEEEEMQPSITEQGEDKEQEQEQEHEDIPIPGETVPGPSYSAGQSFDYPQQPVSYQPQQGTSTEVIEEIAEEIINEKWHEFQARIGNVSELKSSLESDISHLNSRLKKLESRYNNLQKEILFKIQEAHQAFKSMTADVEAIEQAFSKILQPLVSSVKDIDQIKKQVKKTDFLMKSVPRLETKKPIPKKSLRKTVKKNK